MRAFKGDAAGNLWSEGSALNFLPTMAAAGRVTIAEVDEIVPVGAIAPDDVKVPGINVHRVVLHDASLDAELEQRQQGMRRRRPEAQSGPEIGLSRELMVLRVARLLKPGQYVNLGMGLPTLVGTSSVRRAALRCTPRTACWDTVPSRRKRRRLVLLQRPEPARFAAAGRFLLQQPGCVHHGARRPAGRGRPGRTAGLGKGRSCQLVGATHGRGRHGRRHGPVRQCARVDRPHGTHDSGREAENPRECSYPLTARACVTKIVTELAYIVVTPDGLLLKETAPDVTPEYVQERTEPRLIIAKDLREMEF